MRLLISRGVGETNATKAYEVGHVQKMPYTDILVDNCSVVDSVFALHQSEFLYDETARIFFRASLLSELHGSVGAAANQLALQKTKSKNEMSRLQKEIDLMVLGLYEIDAEDRRLIEEELGKSTESKDESEMIVSDDILTRVHNLLMWCVGATYGRWDIRMALDKSLIPKLADPFDPLPVCSPGMLLSPDGCSATSGQIVNKEWLRKRVNVLDVPENVPNPTIKDEDYPIKIDWDGILVDDEGHNDDIVKKVREVLSALYGDTADDREKEILDILNIKGLRDYFRQSKNFFDFHKKRYSKSRRKAPIYWLLQTKKKNYGIWLYYHRLDNDTIFKVLRNYIEPKVNLISIQISETGQKAANAEGGEKRASEKDLETLEDIRQEITEFKEELEKVAEMGYDPNFDDGVVLNMAPLHAVTPWKEPAKYWKELESGKYDWAHIAMKYWPDRVKTKCKKDKSLAIAHGLE